MNDVEILVPAHNHAQRRLLGFYDELGWEAYSDTRSDQVTIVTPPDVDNTELVYRRYEGNPRDIGWLRTDTAQRSLYSDGWRRSYTEQSIRVGITVPTAEDVSRLHGLGGKLLSLHSLAELKTKDGVASFQFADPFNYGIWVRSADQSSRGERIEVPCIEGEVISKEDFRMHWGHPGSGHSWAALCRVAAASPDFPLQLLGSDKDVLVGDVRKAITYLDARDLVSRPSFTYILQRIQTQRDTIQTKSTK